MPVPVIDLDASVASETHLLAERRRTVFEVIPERAGDYQGALVIVEGPRCVGFDTGWTETGLTSRNCMAEVEHSGMVVKMLAQVGVGTAAVGQRVAD